MAKICDILKGPAWVFYLNMKNAQPSDPTAYNVCLKKMMSWSGPDYVTKREIFLMERALMVCHRALNVDTRNELDIIEELLGIIPSVRGMRIAPLSSDLWKIIFGYIKFIVNGKSPDRIRIRNRKSVLYADSVNHLWHKGVRCTFDGDEFDFTETKVITDEIVRSLRKVGGKQLLKYMFSVLKFRDNEHRFQLPRQGNQPIIGNVEIDYPWNYLLNLGLRFFHDRGNVTNESSCRKIMDESKYLCFALFPVQKIDTFDDVFHVDRKPLEFIRDVVLKESIFELSQHNPEFTEDFISFVIDALKQQIATENLSIDFDLDDFHYLKGFMESRACDNATSSISIKSLKGRFKTRKVQELLRRILIDAKSINQDFIYPNDLSEVNIWGHPIIKDKDSYYMLPKPISCWLWYGALVKLLRQQDKNGNILLRGIGTIIEDFLKNQFQTHNIPNICGKYRAISTDGTLKVYESDHVIETASNIVLIEDKKRDLSVEGMSGSIIHILEDLADSLIYSQLQCHRTAKEIIEHHNLAIDDNGNVINVPYNNRKFEGITLTLGEFGPLQDRMVLNSLLNTISQNEFHLDFSAPALSKLSSDKRSRLEGNFEKINKRIKELNFYIGKITNLLLPQNTRYKSFFNSWFLNLEQLSFLIGMSNSTEDFYKKILLVKYTNYGSQDFYSEWDAANGNFLSAYKL